MKAVTRTEYYILFAASFIATIWFFVGYPSQDPRSAADITFTKKQIKAKATHQLAELGYASSQYSISNVVFNTNDKLLDSLQQHLGRQQSIKMLRDSTRLNLKPFDWEVTFQYNGSISRASEEPQRAGPPGRNDEHEIKIRLDEQGHFIAFINDPELLPKKRVNRAALGAVFVHEEDSLNKPVLATMSDSVLSRVLIFDMQRNHDNYANYTRKNEAELYARFNRGIPYLYSKNDAQALADYYLKKTGWNLTSLVRDTVYIKRVNTVNAANVRYMGANPLHAQHLQIDVVVSPTGALLQLRPEYNPGQPSSSFPLTFRDAMVVMLYFIFGFALLVMFIYRLRARTIDTHTALVVAIIMGIIVPVFIFLRTASQFNLFSASASLNNILPFLITMGVMGAVSSVGFFVLVSVSDSLTRQYWHQKLSSYDYILQGTLFNKPMGTVLLQSVGLAFILAGIWTLMLQFMPGLYFDISSTFLSNNTLWAPLYLFLQCSWYSLAIVLSIFLVIGSRAFGQSGSKWLVACLTIIACGVVLPVLGGYGPAAYEFLAGAILGAALICIYIKWDFLTLLLSHFLFLGLIGSTLGWITPHSPDMYVFIFVMILFLVVAFAGIAALFLGKDEHALSEYVPGYVEELAQEQRIKQELQIAREVQQSFLPVETPSISDLDLAAACKPAYETGGDYYDFIQLDEHRIAIAVGDVSGKGIQAAFYMTFVKGLLHSLCWETDSPAEVLKKANRLFYDNATKGTFISLIYGIVDAKEKTFTFARAGHNPVLHVNTATGEVNELRPDGLGLGLTKDKIFDNKIEEIQLSITKHDVFLLYTDGIVEALNPAHQFYGTKKLISLIKKNKDKPAAVIVSVVSKAVTSFISKASQHDDMTLMAIRLGDTGD